MNKLQNKNIIIFGATGLIGSQLSFSFASQGANLILHGKSNLKLKTLNDKIEKEFNKPVLLECDIMSENFYLDILKVVSSRFNHIDIMINLIGKFDGLKPLTDLSHREWNELMEVNFNCYWRILKELSPLLGKKNKSKIIFLNNRLIQSGKAYHNILSISKGALSSLAQTLNLEKKKFGIELQLIETPELLAGVTKPLAVEGGYKKKNLDYTVNEITESCIEF